MHWILLMHIVEDSCYHNFNSFLEDINNNIECLSLNMLMFGDLLSKI